MLKQEPLPTHDGRPGNRGSVVNIASQLGIVGRPAARAYMRQKADSLTLVANGQSCLLWFESRCHQHDPL